MVLTVSTIAVERLAPPEYQLPAPCSASLQQTEEVPIRAELRRQEWFQGLDLMHSDDVPFLEGRGPGTGILLLRG
jgi:hypothetical protein